MVSTAEPIVIVGAALAGATAAKTLRDEGYDGPLVLIGAEEHLPYIRPPLSKGLLGGSDDRASIDVLDAAWYHDNDVDLRLATRITRLDTQAGFVVDDRGTATRYDRLLLATGSQPRILTIPGSDAPNVHYLRTVDDSIRLRAAIRWASRPTRRSSRTRSPRAARMPTSSRNSAAQAPHRRRSVRADDR